MSNTTGAAGAVSVTSVGVASAATTAYVPGPGGVSRESSFNSKPMVFASISYQAPPTLGAKLIAFRSGVGDRHGGDASGAVGITDHHGDTLVVRRPVRCGRVAATVDLNVLDAGESRGGSAYAEHEKNDERDHTARDTISHRHNLLQTGPQVPVHALVGQETMCAKPSSGLP